MEVNLNSIRHPLPVETPASHAAAQADAPVRSPGWSAPARGVRELASVAGEVEISDSSLRRDDALGALVDRAFSEQPPPCPVVGDGPA